MTGRLSRAAGTAGTLAAFLGVLGALGCCGLGILGLAGVVGALGLVPAAWAYEVLYASLGLALVALATNRRAHGRALPLALGAIGSLALLLAFHEAWDVAAFRLLIGVGGAALLAAVGADLRAAACHRAARRVDRRSPLGVVGWLPEDTASRDTHGRKACAG